MAELGTMFKEARLKLGLTIIDMAERTKIRTEFLVAIEEEEFHQLPGEAYVRPFIRTYARALGLDEAQIALELDVQLAPSKEELAQEKEEQERMRIANRNRIMLHATGWVIAIIGVGLILYWLLT